MKDGSFDGVVPRAEALDQSTSLRLKGIATTTAGRVTAIGVVSLINSEARSAERLARSEHSYRELARASGALVWHADAFGRMQPLDDSWSDFLGVPNDEIAGHGWLSFVHHSDVEVVSRIWTATLQSQRANVATFRLRRKDGAWRDMHVDAVPLHDPAGRFEEWFGVTTDITE
nr:PAS domain-containing protein [Caballeronia sp. GAFFF1]